MTQIELKQQLNSMVTDKTIVDVMFYQGTVSNMIVVVYSRVNYKDYIEYTCWDFTKIQDVLNHFDEEDRISLGSNNSNVQDAIRLV